MKKGSYRANGGALLWWLRRYARTSDSLSTTLAIGPLPMANQSSRADEKSSPLTMREVLEQARAEISATRTPTDTRFQTKWSLHQHRQCSGSRGAKQ